MCIFFSCDIPDWSNLITETQFLALKFSSNYMPVSKLIPSSTKVTPVYVELWIKIIKTVFVLWLCNVTQWWVQAYLNRELLKVLTKYLQSRDLIQKDYKIWRETDFLSILFINKIQFNNRLFYSLGLVHTCILFI